jgi:DNA-binding transcriptional ArsR family regulator
MDGFAAVADPTRRKIIELLALQGQLSATQIAAQFAISAQAISQHLKILREAGVLHMEKRAQQRLYRINPDRMREIEAWAQRIAYLWQARFDAIAALLEAEERHNEPQENNQNESIQSCHQA